MRKVKNTHPMGEAEAKRLARRADAEDKLRHAEAKLAEAAREHKEATQDYLQAGIGSSSVHRDAAKKQMDDMLLYVEHYKTAITMYDGEEPRGLCAQWDITPNAPEQFRSSIQPDIVAAQKAAVDLVRVMVSMRQKFADANASANNLGLLKKDLAGYGIVVKETRPSLVWAQEAIALALRKALIDAGLSPTEHYVVECLSPKHYKPHVKPEEVAA